MKEFKELLLKHKITKLIGVPCSIFKNFLKNFESDKDIEVIYVAKENIALGIQQGLLLSGEKSLIFSQNSGLGNMINGLTSFIDMYNAPFFSLISFRGRPGEKDAPQHKLMGNISMPILDLCKIEFEISDNYQSFLKEFDNLAQKTFEKNQKNVLVISKGVF